jgi:nicotinamide mononucleotide transporter
MQRFYYGLAVVLSLVLMLGSIKGFLELNPVEAGGFVTGAWCVWLTVKQNIWNWPIGIANNLFFINQFWHARLYADMSLQIIYIVLGAIGWYWWLHGGRNRSILLVSHTPRTTAFMVAAVGAASTVGMTLYLRHIHDSAPFLDALTTTLSLCAQFLMTKKMIENWYLWIAADVLYIGLFTYKHQSLTAALNLLFLIMCLVGLRVWRKSLREQGEDYASSEPAATYV